ncbi:vesicle-associated membrane protein 5-like [Scleropages formosus]|uniref:Vesicle-associated membrane protein 5-like n=1 Tax=Scleropages formosus TaxID=113540 RepID=A0A0P7UNM5_SCLFO|nr:vesicle-associated membrane protein 5-like [Scleropages formosus]
MSASGSSRLEQAKCGAEEVMHIMLKNIDRSQERSENLDDLMDRANNLRNTTDIFRRTSVKVTQKTQPKTRKRKILLITIVVGVIALMLTVVGIALLSSGNSDSEKDTSDGALALTTTAPTKNYQTSNETSGNSRLEKVHQEVDEVKTIMLDNINKNEERSGKLKELEDRADQVCVKSKSFRRTTVRVKQQSQWKNRKMKILLIAIVAGVGLSPCGNQGTVLQHGNALWVAVEVGGCTAAARGLEGLGSTQGAAAQRPTPAASPNDDTRASMARALQRSHHRIIVDSTKLVGECAIEDQNVHREDPLTDGGCVLQNKTLMYEEDATLEESVKYNNPKQYKQGNHNKQKSIELQIRPAAKNGISCM